MKKSIGANTALYPTPAVLVGTYDQQGKPNIMTVAWAGICCSKPPCVGIALRKATYTFGCLMGRQAFTVSIPSEEHVRVVDYCGVVSGRDEDKFAACKLTPVKADKVDAPYVQEFPVILECQVRHVLEIGLHTQFVGEILDVKVEESLLDPSGKPDVTRIKPIFYAPMLQLYFGTGPQLIKAFTVRTAPTG